MLASLTTILGVAALFFLVLPGVGALTVRRRWRLFRSRIHDAVMAEPVSYGRVHRSSGARGGGNEGEGEAGLGLPADRSLDGVVRITGRLESIQDEQILWVRSDQLSVAVDMARSDVYVVAQESEAALAGPPLRTSWKRLGSIPEGARVLVCGSLDRTGDQPVIRASATAPVLAVFYDGPLSTLVRRCIWSGRQLNEYWNPATPAALAGGTLALVILAYLILSRPADRLIAQVTIALASLPAIPLLPPGVGLFYVYRRGWRRGRLLRALRDVLQLPYLFETASARIDDDADGVYTARIVDADEGDALRAAGVLCVDTLVAGWPNRLRPFGRILSGRRQTPTARSYYYLFESSRPVDRDVELFEPMLTTDEPQRQSAQCARWARRYEIVSTLMLIVGIVLNLGLFLVVVNVLL